MSRKKCNQKFLSNQMDEKLVFDNFHPGEFHPSKFHPGHVHFKVQSETFRFLFLDKDHDSKPILTLNLR